MGAMNFGGRARSLPAAAPESARPLRRDSRPRAPRWIGADLSPATVAENIGARGIRLDVRHESEVEPSTVESAWVRRLVEDAGKSLDALRARQPLARLDTPEEIADAVADLAAAEVVTGSVLVSGGGLVAA